MTVPSSAPRLVKGLAGLRELAGQSLGTAPPFVVTKDRIQEFCRAVDNDEWIHWDEDRCAAEGLGTVIAPGLFLPSLFPRHLFDLIRIADVPRMFFLGIDRLRLLTPIRAGETVTATLEVREVEERAQGIAVRYGVTWHIVGQPEPAAVATMVVRYLPG